MDELIIVLTNSKIQVTHRMMCKAGMTRYWEYGVPVNPKDTSEGLVWKKMFLLNDKDFDTIEEYFLNKTTKDK